MVEIKYEIFSGLFRNRNFKFRSLYIIIFILFSISVISQEATPDSVKIKPRKNAVYVAYLGNGVVLPTINYERLFSAGKFTPGIRIGFGFIPYNKTEYYYSIPVELFVYFGQKKHHFELGIGVTPSNYSLYFTSYPKEYLTITTDYYIMPRIGYRYTATIGLVIRAGFIPAIQRPVPKNLDHPFQPHFGISIGYSF